MAFLKKYWRLILIIAVIVIFSTVLLLRKRNVSFDFTIGGDLGSILGGLSNKLQQGGNEKGIGVYLDVPLTTIVKNNGATSIALKNIIGSFSYNGENVLQTKANSPALANVKVGAKSSTTITDSVQVLLNPSTLKFFTELVKGNKPTVNYNLQTTLFGVPYSFTNSTNINKS